MLHPFVSVPTARRNLAPVLALSASVHAGLLYGALTSTGAVRPTSVPALVAEQVRMVALPFRVAASHALRSNARAQRARRADGQPAFKLPQLLLSFDLLLPEPIPLPDFQPEYAPLEIGESGVIVDDALQLGVGRGSATSRLPAGALHGAYEEFAVEKRVVPAAANPKPRYPYQMLSRRIETNFNVTFVVDTTGVVDQQTVELPPSVHEAFISAVSEALFNWRFRPAELGGRRVRQRVLQPFTFRMEGQYSSIGRP
jgi:TonB family protein